MIELAAKRKAMYKMASPLSWKENYKQRCAERLKNSRAKLLSRFRNSTDEVDDIMTEEFQLMKEELCPSTNDFSDFDDVLRCMEDIKSELLEWETELMLSYENQMMHVELDLPSAENAVICPLCKLRSLKVHYNTVQCDCGLRIDTNRNSLSLANLKAWLEEGVNKHSSHCFRPPDFSVVKDFGTSHLLITCSQCDYMYIVI